MINLLKTNGIYIRKMDESVEFDNYKETKLTQVLNIIKGVGVESYYEVISFSDYRKDMTLNSNSHNLIATYYTSKNEVFEIVQNHMKSHTKKKQHNILLNENCIEIKDGITKFYLYKNTLYENVLNFNKVDGVKKIFGSFIFIPFH